MLLASIQKDLSFHIIYIEYSIHVGIFKEKVDHLLKSILQMDDVRG